jgi:hypothetical protein
VGGGAGPSLAHGTSRRLLRLLHLADAVATDELLARVGIAVESDATAGLFEQKACLESRAKCPGQESGLPILPTFNCC